jgi:N-formylmaleamate deformylase
MVASGGSVIEEPDVDELLQLNSKIQVARMQNAGPMMPWG